jgi:uncharacterized caspase-like protein
MRSTENTNLLHRKASIARRRQTCAPRLAPLAALMLAFVLPTARAQTQRGLEPLPAPPTSRAQMGGFYALVIGIDSYHPPLPALKTAVNDAKTVGAMLQARYGFQVRYLLDSDATRFNILDALGKLRGALGENDSLLIYYAGHGYSDHAAQKAYWIPVDADSAFSPNRIIADDLTTAVRGLLPRHILIISDSCYSGDLANSRAIDDSDEEGAESTVIARMLNSKSRTLMASGGDEPVSDSGSNGHSIFAYGFLKSMEETNKPMFTAASLFYGSLQRKVAGRSPQTPRYDPIRNSDDDGGDFIFVRSDKASMAALADLQAHQPANVPYTAPSEPQPASAPSPGTADIQHSLNALRMTIPNISAALSSCDAKFLKEAVAAGVRPNDIEQALRQKSADGKSTVAQEFFENAANMPEAMDWLSSILTAGLDPNMTVPSAYYGQEGLLIAAMRAGNAKAVKLLLQQGASPHAYQDLFLTRFAEPRFLYPLQALAENDRFDLTEKQDIAKAFIQAGVAIPDPAPMKPGARPIPIEEAREIQDQTVSALGMPLPPSPLCCRQPTPICKQAAKRTGEDWCAIVAKIPTMLSTAFRPGESAPLWDVQLRYLLAIQNNKAYFMGLRDLNSSFTSVGYVLVEVSKDGSNWTVLTYIPPGAGLGLCKKDGKDDTAPPADDCWRRFPLHRVAGTDQMRFDEYGLTWKIEK